MTFAKKHRSILLGSLLIAAVALPLVGCESSSSNDPTKNYNAENPPSPDLAIPVRIEKSDVVDFASPNVEVHEDTLVVNGNVRVHTGKENPMASMHIAVMKRNGVVGNEMQVKLQETDQPNVMQYSIRFGPVPQKGEWLMLTYNDWHPENDYTGADIGEGASDVGGAGRGHGGGGGGATNNPPGKAEGTTNSHSSKGAPKFGGATPMGGKIK